MPRYDYERTYPNAQRFAVAVSLIILAVCILGFACDIPLLFSYETEVTLTEGTTQTITVQRSTVDTQMLFVGWIAGFIGILGIAYVILYTLFALIENDW